MKDSSPNINIEFFSKFSVEKMIIGNDLDALLSSCLLKSKFGWDIVGIYDYHTIWFDAKQTKQDFLKNLKSQKYIAVDLDIYRNYLPSVGHHILSLHPDDILPQHENTLNPNLLRGITHEKFKQKYPMGTVHFLMWLFDDYLKITRLGELLLWLADSTFINAQSHRFRENVKDWLENFVPNNILKNGFDAVDTKAFETEVRKSAFPVLYKTGLGRGKGQVKSRHLKLQGYQCQWMNPNDSRKKIINLLQIIKENLEWESPHLPESFNFINGTRDSKRIKSSELNQKEFLRRFLGDKKVFSYVITNKNLINFTTGIDY